MRIKRYLILGVLLSLLSAVLTVQAQGLKAPAWELKDGDGQTISFPRNNDKHTILLFWATWCPFCKNLMPHIQSIVDEYGDDKVEVLAINVFEDGDPLEYLTERAYEFHHLPDGEPVAKIYGVQGTPGLFLVNPAGEVAFDLSRLQQAPKRVEGASKNWQRATRIAPFWAAKLRQALDFSIAYTEHNKQSQEKS